MDRYSELNEQIDKMRLHIEVLESKLELAENMAEMFELRIKVLEDWVTYNDHQYLANTWYPLENENEYWVDGEVDQCFTLVTDGVSLYNKSNCPYGWSTMIKAGYWKFMIVKIK